MIWYHIIFPMQCTHDKAHPDDCFLSHRSWSPKPGATTPVEEPTMDMTWVCHGQWLIFPMIFSMFVDFHGCSWLVDFSINEFAGRCIQWFSHGLFRYVFFLVTGEQLFSCVKPTHCATFSIYLSDLTRSYKPYFFSEQFRTFLVRSRVLTPSPNPGDDEITLRDNHLAFQRTCSMMGWWLGETQQRLGLGCLTFIPIIYIDIACIFLIHRYIIYIYIYMDK